MTVWWARACGMNSSPDGLIFKVSTPSRTIRRDILRNSSGPSQMTAKVSRCICMRRTSPSPEVTVISGLAANVRGPGKSPALIALRSTTSSRGFAAAALLQAVKPWSSIFFAFFTVRNMCSSGGTKPRPSEIRGIQKSDVRMRFDQARHQGGAAAIDQPRAIRGNRSALRRDRLNAVTLHQNLTRVRRSPGTVQHIDVLEQSLSHVISPRRKTDFGRCREQRNVASPV